MANIYPDEHIKLAEKISESGAVISEFPMFTRPDKGNFPKRNRVISGLSLGVVCVEAAEKSGALITCDCGLEQNREVQFIQQELCRKIVESSVLSLEYLQILKGKLDLVAM